MAFDKHVLELLMDYSLRLKKGEDPDPQKYLDRYHGKNIDDLERGLQLELKLYELSQGEKRKHIGSQDRL